MTALYLLAYLVWRWGEEKAQNGMAGRLRREARHPSQAVLGVWLALGAMLTLGMTCGGLEAAEGDSRANHPSAYLEQVLLAEGASEGFEGMRWIACTMRERGWNLRGYAGSRRADLTAFAARQPKRVREDAKTALASVQAGFDCGGATHFENVQAFGVPRWAKHMTVVRVVGQHTFWRE